MSLRGAKLNCKYEINLNIFLDCKRNIHFVSHRVYITLSSAIMAKISSLIIKNVASFSADLCSHSSCIVKFSCKQSFLFTFSVTPHNKLCLTPDRGPSFFLG